MNTNTNERGTAAVVAIQIYQMHLQGRSRTMLKNVCVCVGVSVCVWVCMVYECNVT